MPCFGTFVFDPVIFLGLKIIFDHLDIRQFWFRNYNILCTNMLHTNIERDTLAKTPFQTYLLALFQLANFLIINR